MPAVRVRDVTPPKRRVPRQERSRRRVEEILDAAARLVVEVGVDDLTTREIAEAAGAPVASLYQYFADKEGVLLALAERDMAEMDEQVAVGLGGLERVTVASVVRTTMDAFVTVYHRRRAFVEIYLRGRSNAAVAEFGRQHNRRVAADLRQFAVDAGVVRQDLPLEAAVLAVEVGDRVFQLAFERDDRGDRRLIEEGRTMVTAYLERYATPSGIGRS